MLKLTIEQIKRSCTAQSFHRGQSYYNNDAIFDTALRGDQLVGYCQGSEPKPYRIQVTFGDKGIESASCTCLYEYGGYCKHVVALLLTYVGDPDAFPTRPSVKEELLKRSKEQLVALIELMVDRYPDLQDIADRPMPSGKPGDVPVSTAVFRREISKALKGYGGYDDTPAEDSVYSALNAAKAFAKNRDFYSASAICRAILEECMSDSNEFLNHDYNGDLSVAVGDVLETLGEYAEHFTGDAAERQRIFKAMLDVTLWGSIDNGGTDLGADVPDVILSKAKAEDIAVIREHVEAAKGRVRKSPYSDGWEFFAEFLANLDLLDNVDPDVVLQKLRDDERYPLLMEKLVAFQRLDEAIKVVEEHLTDPFARSRALYILTQAGCEDDAIRLAQESLKTAYHNNLVDWLLQRYQSRGDREAHFQLQLRRMREDPSPEHYRELKAAARAMGNWDSVRADILKQVEASGNKTLLIRLYLLDEVWDKAWDTLEKTEKPKSTWDLQSYRLDLEVAEASAKARPEKAIPVFIHHARQQINQRTRDNYRQAAIYLSTVRDLYQQTDRHEVWQELIKSIREEFRKLPALQDELRQAKL